MAETDGPLDSGYSYIIVSSVYITSSYSAGLQKVICVIIVMGPLVAETDGPAIASSVYRLYYYLEV